jgi:hypothetical protein
MIIWVTEEIFSGRPKAHRGQGAALAETTSQLDRRIDPTAASS